MGTYQFRLLRSKVRGETLEDLRQQVDDELAARGCHVEGHVWFRPR